MHMRTHTHGHNFSDDLTPNNIYTNCKSLIEDAPSQKTKTSHLADVSFQSIVHVVRCYVEIEDVVGAVPTGDAPNYIWVINNCIAF